MESLNICHVYGACTSSSICVTVSEPPAASSLAKHSTPVLRQLRHNLLHIRLPLLLPLRRRLRRGLLLRCLLLRRANPSQQRRQRGVPRQRTIGVPLHLLWWLVVGRCLVLWSWRSAAEDAGKVCRQGWRWRLLVRLLRRL